MRRVLMLILLLIPSLAAADEVRVISSGGVSAALKVLVPEFEATSGHTVSMGWGPSMGDTVDAVPQRVARGEPIDVVIMVGYALGRMKEAGRVSERLDLADSRIGMAVKQGAPVPDIGTVEALRTALLAARSVAYSDSASGVYIQNQMFKTMGIEAEMRPKSRMVPADPVGEVVARGEAEIGFQQISELKPVPGITLVGPIPEGVQSVTVFSAGIMADARHKAAAQALLAFLASPRAAEVMRQSGLEPLTGKGG